MEELSNSKVFELRKKHKKLREKFSLFTKLDKARLNTEMQRISSMTYSVGETKATAEYEMDMAESRLEVIEAKTDRRIRAKFTGKRKPSEQQIKSMVLRHPDVMRAREAFIEAKWKHNLCWAAVKAMDQKGNQLTNMAYNYRKELDRGLGSKVKEDRMKEKGKQYMEERKGE